MIPNLS